jgi:hypothetical protein
VIRERKEELLRLHAQYAPKEEPRPNGRRAHSSSPRSDEEVIEKARSEKNGKFDRLWRGDTSDYGHDHSDADDGFVHKLWPYTQDEEQVRRIHAASGLHRAEKSGRRPDYLRRSIERARKNVDWFYEWPDHVAVTFGGSNNLSAAYKVEVPAERKIRFRTAKEVAAETPAQTEWVAFPYLAKGAITELDGKIKAGGKTTWASHMAGCIVDGKPFMGEPTARTSIVYLTEQQPASFRKVLERAGLTEREDVWVLHWHDVAGLEWPEVARRAAEKAEEVGAGVLFVDTLGQFAGIRGDGENSAGEAHRAMRPLQEAAAKGLAVCITRHERKGGGEVGESGRGSSAFGGAVDIILSIRRADGNVRPTVRVIESLSRFEETPDKLVIELTPDGYRSLGDATAFAEEEARAAILEVLPATLESALATSELLDKLKEQDVKRTAAQGALNQLVNTGEVTRTGAGKRGDPYRYFLSADTPAPSGGMNAGYPPAWSETPDDGDEILSAGTSTLYAAERKEQPKKPLSSDLRPGESATLEELRARRDGREELVL